MDEVHQRSSLPFDSKGFELDNFFIQFQPDRIVFGSRIKGPGNPHYTLMLRQPSGIIDLHKTYKDNSGNEHNETVMAIRAEAIPHLLKDLGSHFLIALNRLIRKTSIGWLTHRHIFIVKGPFSIEEDMNRVFRLGRKKRLIIDKQLASLETEVLEYPDDIFVCPDGMFLLISCRRKRIRQVGFLHKVTIDRIPRLFWMKDRDLVRFGREFGDLLLQKLKDYEESPNVIQEWLKKHGY